MESPPPTAFAGVGLSSRDVSWPASIVATRSGVGRTGESCYRGRGRAAAAAAAADRARSRAGGVCVSCLFFRVNARRSWGGPKRSKTRRA